MENFLTKMPRECKISSLQENDVNFPFHSGNSRISRDLIFYISQMVKEENGASYWRPGNFVDI